jgi:hypothetical protein
MRISSSAQRYVWSSNDNDEDSDGESSEDHASTPTQEQPLSNHPPSSLDINTVTDSGATLIAQPLTSPLYSAPPVAEPSSSPTEERRSRLWPISLRKKPRDQKTPTVKKPKRKPGEPLYLNKPDVLDEEAQKLFPAGSFGHRQQALLLSQAFTATC